MKSIITVFILSIALMANAKQTHSVRANQHIQQAKIRDGVRSGRLTPHEAKRLEVQQSRINQEKKAAKADGVVTRQEHAKIVHDQHKADQNIRNQKSDAQHR